MSGKHSFCGSDESGIEESVDVNDAVKRLEAIIKNPQYKNVENREKKVITLFANRLGGSVKANQERVNLVLDLVEKIDITRLRSQSPDPYCFGIFNFWMEKVESDESKPEKEESNDDSVTVQIASLVCLNCKKRGYMKRCKGCSIDALYCDKKCQLEHWVHHSKIH